MNPRYFVICERDAGLFSMLQTVVANLPRALNAGRIPVACFGPGCCYAVPGGHRGADTVWEYYFEPLVAGAPAAVVPAEVRTFAREAFPDAGSPGRTWNDTFELTNNFGDHPSLLTQVLVIPFQWDDPDAWTRAVAARLMARFVRPRAYLLEDADDFARRHFGDGPVIGVHVRGTDAISAAEPRNFRRGSLALERYEAALRSALERFPTARIFVATDDQRSLDRLQAIFGERVLALPALRHTGGEAAGRGPTGALMPAYVAADPAAAARNGEEALTEWLLLLRCRLLIHNGASLARTVLLRAPAMEHINTHRPTWRRRLQAWKPLYSLRQLHARLRRRRVIRFEAWKEAGLW